MFSDINESADNFRGLWYLTPLYKQYFSYIMAGTEECTDRHNNQYIPQIYHLHGIWTNGQPRTLKVPSL
jgi:hypothetical protein